ncbi:DNA ligase D [Acidobacteria bacterium AB60]|nr:DNA ligase D [Acidobacteria bacterium AB60]
MATPRKTAPRKKKDPADEQLARYRSMRDFNVTREPSGGKVHSAAPNGSLPFVIQKHAATRLHYDFRLGWNGVLKSWAVAKGPSYYPGDKRLAVEVEDHPMDYGGFEGIIPKGQYGGGTVMLWDRGSWEPHGDVDEGLKKGSLKFTLHGEKMRGSWALVRMKPRPGDRADKPNWLLIKEHDGEERAETDAPVTEAEPDSVLSGRSIAQIAEDSDRVWNSNRTDGATPGEQAVPKPKKSKARDRSKDLKGAAKERLPSFIEPQLASLAKAPPSGGRWVHEIKLDGYRIEIRIDGEKKKVQLLTRTGLDWTHRMTALAAAARDLPVKSALIDGEMVVLLPDGTSSFAELQAAFQEGAKKQMTYFAFDLLHLDGHNLRDLPLTRRKEILHDLLGNGVGPIRVSEHIEGEGAVIFRKACELKTEGIISKLADGKYVSGRAGGWLKNKCGQEQEFVVGGFTLPTNGSHGVGALLLGYHENGELIYAGRTGTGFTQKIHRDLRDRLDKLRASKPAFAKLPAEARKGAVWVKPELVAQVAFSTWTTDNLVRQAAFKGLREDKPAKSVVREKQEAGSGRIAAESIAHEGPEKKKTNRTATLPEKLPIKLTHPDKVLDSESGATKAMLARYYMEIAENMLPHINDRPLTLVRCPDGIGKGNFYQKHLNQMLGDGFKSITVVDRKTGAQEPYITLANINGIVQFAQIAVLEIHPWGSRNETMEQPDRLIIDLDPDSAIDWKTLAASAKEVRKRLKKLGLTSFVKTTGGKGLHVVVPMRPQHAWSEVKQFAHDFVLGMERDAPRLFLTKMSKAARVGKIFLDYLRNDRGSTAVAPYSPRARVGLPVAMPLRWSELDGKELPRFQVSDIQVWRKRLSRDPWEEMLETDQELSIS